MKSRWLVVLVLVAGGGITWWYAREVTSGSSASKSNPTRSSLLSGHSALREVGGPRGGNPSPQEGHPAALQEINPAVLALLQRPKPWSYKGLPRPSEVPLLDPITQAEVIRRLQTPGSPTNKLMLICILAFGGDAEVVKVFARALTNDYAGQHLTVNEGATLGAAVGWLGVTARRQPEAAVFLEQACDPGYWRSVKLWNTPFDDSERYTERSLLGAAIKALAWSGRPQGDRVLQRFHDNPALAFDANVIGAVVDAAWVRYMVSQQGFEAAWDILGSNERAYNAFARWVRETPEGRAWRDWAGKASRRGGTQ